MNSPGTIGTSGTSGTTGTTGLELARLLRLASPALPVGAYSYSQGLEAAVEAGTVHDIVSAERWLGDMLRLVMARLEAPVWRHLHAAWLAEDVSQAQAWNDWFLCTRESAELRAETLQMGYSLRRLFVDLNEFGPEGNRELESFAELAFPTAFAFAAARWGIPAQDALTAYLWSWLENQVMAAVKAIPLGQTDGQRLLSRLSENIIIITDESTLMDELEINNYAHGLAIASSNHETQYSRLFRS